jgi:hypothetical protein
MDEVTQLPDFISELRAPFGDDDKENGDETADGILFRITDVLHPCCQRLVRAPSSAVAARPRH